MCGPETRCRPALVGVCSRDPAFQDDSRKGSRSEDPAHRQAGRARDSQASSAHGPANGPLRGCEGWARTPCSCSEVHLPLVYLPLRKMPGIANENCYSNAAQTQMCLELCQVLAFLLTMLMQRLIHVTSASEEQSRPNCSLSNRSLYRQKAVL